MPRPYPAGNSCDHTYIVTERAFPAKDGPYERTWQKSPSSIVTDPVLSVEGVLLFSISRKVSSNVSMKNRIDQVLPPNVLKSNHTSSIPIKMYFKQGSIGHFVCSWYSFRIAAACSRRSLTIPSNSIRSIPGSLSILLVRSCMDDVVVLRDASSLEVIDVSCAVLFRKCSASGVLRFRTSSANIWGS